MGAVLSSGGSGILPRNKIVLSADIAARCRSHISSRIIIIQRGHMTEMITHIKQWIMNDSELLSGIYIQNTEYEQHRFSI
jgi:hypothetical protein